MCFSRILHLLTFMLLTINQACAVGQHVTWACHGRPAVQHAAQTCSPLAGVSSAPERRALNELEVSALPGPA